MKEKDLQKGFTIVEVALVLAIAGLIFLMAFIALPALQRSQRDAKRRDDVGVLLTAIQKYQNNNRGALPEDTSDEIGWNQAQTASDSESTWKKLYKSFLGERFQDPLGYNYKLVISYCGATGTGDCVANTDLSSASFPNSYKMYIVKSATCDGSKAIGSGNPRKVAVLYKLEGGGGAYCASMQ